MSMKNIYEGAGNESANSMLQGIQSGTYRNCARPFFEDGAYFIGTASTKSVAIRFCPWCRVNLRKRSQLESSARKVVNVLSDNLKEWDDLKDAIIKMSEYLEYER